MDEYARIMIKDTCRAFIFAGFREVRDAVAPSAWSLCKPRLLLVPLLTVSMAQCCSLYILIVLTNQLFLMRKHGPFSSGLLFIFCCLLFSFFRFVSFLFVSFHLLSSSLASTELARR